MTDLFTNTRPDRQEIYPNVWLLANFVDTTTLKCHLPEILAQSPFRKMMTPMGHYTGIPLTNCGQLGWYSDKQGYHYVSRDPENNLPWPAIPKDFMLLAKNAAELVGYPGFEPDACLINRYEIGSKLSAHQDKNERDFNWPIVSVSIDLPCVFQIFGAQRTGKPISLNLHDGDVMVWGGKSRLIYHGVKTVQVDRLNPTLSERINITFRRAG